MITPEQAHELARLVEELVEGIDNQCDGNRFALVLWCDCANSPTFAVSNDPDDARTIKMLNATGEGFLGEMTVEQRYAI